ncbi:MAG: hypothetical protein ACJ735_03815 [Actinomycetes bacterium]
MEEDIDFDESFQLFPGVDLTLWLAIAVGVVLSVLAVAVVMWIA